MLGSTYKYLRVEESCHPEDARSTVEAPRVKLCVPLDKLCEPESNSAAVPGDSCPERRDFRVKYEVERFSQLLTHYNSSFYGQLEVGQCISNAGNNSLHPIYLLLQEDIHGR